MFPFSFNFTAMAVGVAAVAAAAGGEETPIMTAATNATTDMTSTTTDIGERLFYKVQSRCCSVMWEKTHSNSFCLSPVAGALHRPTTVDTGPAHGLAPTAHVSVKTNAYEHTVTALVV